MEIVQIVPQLPPAVNGLGDSAYLLAQELSRAHAITTKFIVCHPRAEAAPDLDGFECFVTERTAQSLLEVLDRISAAGAPVLLHYVGYGYARRGCPFWLADGLRKWRSSGQHRPLVTMFYEIYAAGPPWRSSFWTAPLQRSIAADLVRISDTCRTNMQRYARILKMVSGQTEITVMPVFSNVGEPSHLQPLAQRKRRLVVFGGAAWRSLVYTQHRSELLTAIQLLELEELIDVGPPIEMNLEFSIPFQQCGVLRAVEVSALLNDTMIGALCYPPEFLGKSGIFAAYAAHGVVPILLGNPKSENEDDLREGREYVSLKSAKRAALGNISRAIHSWYGQHDLASTARAYARIIAHLTT